MKKNNPIHLCKHYSLLLLGFILITGTACKFNNVSPEPEPEPQPAPPPPADTVGTVQPDGILEAVTWNLEWLGTGVGYADDFGPVDEILQRNNAVEIIDSLEADLYAFQEINDQAWLDSLTTYMKGYNGIIAEHITYNQKTAFVYNTQTIEVVSMGAIEASQDEDAWAGRLPFYFHFNYKYPQQDITLPVYAIVIHGKCCSDAESYQRRMRAAESLYDYLTRNKPNANIILLGDYNDDVDESIYQGAESPYAPYVNDDQNFVVITRSLSLDGQSSTVSYDDMIDHITISDELVPYYIQGSVKAFTRVSSFIEDYATTTTDHYPIIAKFNVTQ